MTYIVCHSIYTKSHTGVNLCKGFIHRAFKNTSYQKDTLNVRKIYFKDNENIKGNVENRYVMQGRAIVQEIVRIISVLNCIHKDYSTLHERSVLKN